MPECDVAIIGAGPAGAAAARLLAAWRHRVVLLERSVKGSPESLRGSADTRSSARTLAESIPPSCRKLFAAIGVLDAIDRAGFYRSTGNTVWWGSDQPRREVFTGGAHGYQVERSRFDDLMRTCAVGAGAELIEATVREVNAGAEGARIVAADCELRARFVLDCSGRAGVVARRGWRVDVPGHLRTVGLVGVWHCRDGWPAVDPTHTLVESYEDGWAWSVPLSPTIRYVTAMVDPQRTELARGRPARDVYAAELRKTPHMSSVTAGATLEAGPWGCDASVYTARPYARAPVLIVGDAGTFIDPLSSFGIKKAVASAWLAAVAVHTSLRTPSMTDTALEFFSARETEMASSLIEQARTHFGAAAFTHANPFWTDRAAPVDLPSTRDPDVRVLREDPRVLRAFAAMKAHPDVAFSAGAAVRVEHRPIVRGNEIVLEDRLFVPDLPDGVRFLRDVDVVTLLALVRDHRGVPSLFDAYNRRSPPVALPDFLGALSVMTALGMLALTNGDW